MEMRDRLIELMLNAPQIPCIKGGQATGKRYQTFQNIADHLLANGVIVPPCKVGDEIWVIDREDGEAVDISCIQFLAKSKGCIIGTSWINDLDIDETIEYHINETQENFDCELKVYPDEDCFLTKEEAENALKGSVDNGNERN